VTDPELETFAQLLAGLGVTLNEDFVKQYLVAESGK